MPTSPCLLSRSLKPSRRENGYCRAIVTPADRRQATAILSELQRPSHGTGGNLEKPAGWLAPHLEARIVRGDARRRSGAAVGGSPSRRAVRRVIDDKAGLAARALDGSDEEIGSSADVQLEALVSLLTEALEAGEAAG